MIVRRPSDARNFNGTVVVEWLNVTAQFDTSPDWEYSRVELMRKGYVWVGISAQFIGVDGPVAGLKLLDPVRYGSLVHPGDAYSYDIYSQAARAITRPRGVNPLPGFDVDELIADGESQSASRMTTYVNAIAPVTGLYDAYLIHSRSAGASGLGATGVGTPPPTPTFIRTDLSTPVFVFEAETDIPRYAPARQPDSAAVHTWEVAGTAHADQYMIGPAAAGVLGCTQPVNTGPQHYVFHTALRDLRRWMLKPSRVPPTAPRDHGRRAECGRSRCRRQRARWHSHAATRRAHRDAVRVREQPGSVLPVRHHRSVHRRRTAWLTTAPGISTSRSSSSPRPVRLDAKFFVRDDAFAVFAEAFNFPFPA